MKVREIESIKATEVKPGDKTIIFDECYHVRYINYHGTTLTLRLQPEDEPLSPFTENDRIVMTVPNDLLIDVVL